MVYSWNLRRVLVDDVAEDQRVEQREDLVDRGEHERRRDETAVMAQVAVQELHIRLQRDVLFYRLAEAKRERRLKRERGLLPLFALW